MMCCHCSVKEYQENHRESNSVLYPLVLEFCTCTAQQRVWWCDLLKHISCELLWNETWLLCSVCMVHTPAFYYAQIDYEIPDYTVVSWYSQVIYINITMVLDSSEIYIAKAMATCFCCLAIFKPLPDLYR